MFHGKGAVENPECHVNCLFYNGSGLVALLLLSGLDAGPQSGSRPDSPPGFESPGSAQPCKNQDGDGGAYKKGQYSTNIM